MQVGLLFLGLLFLAWSIAAVPAVLVMFQMEPSEFVPNPDYLAISSVLSTALFGVLGLLLVFAPSSLTEFFSRRLNSLESSSNLTAYELLVIGLVLLGVYFSIAGIRGLIREFPVLIEIQSSFAVFQFIAHATQLVLGLALAFRPSVFLRVISVNKSFKSDTGDAGAS